MSDGNANALSNPQDDAERIRLKRLAKLQGASASSSAGRSPPAPQTSVQPAPSSVQTFTPTKRQTLSQPADSPTPPPKRKASVTPVKLDLRSWEHDAVGYVFSVTLDKNVSERSDYETTWLKSLAAELESENPSGVPKLSADIADRLLIARLELDPQGVSDGLKYPQTTFEYLVGCWKRLNARAAILRKGYSPTESHHALDILEKIRDLVVSYAGLSLQEPEMFPQPSGRPLGHPELVALILSLSAPSAPLLSSSATTSLLSQSDIEVFLHDLAKRFEPDNEIENVLGPVVFQLAFDDSLLSPQGLAGSDAKWRGVAGGLEILTSIKSVSIMITSMKEWNPPIATAATFERISLMGPLCRLGVFGREWPSIAQTYFSDPENRSQSDVESSFASLRGTLKSLQLSLFRIFDALVRASVESREAVLGYFARVISLNVKRSGMQVDPETVATDSFMVNLQSVLLMFAKPFMDPNYAKIDRIDPHYYAHSTRLDIKEETRVKATSDEATEWVNEIRVTNSSPPNFISDIFHLNLALSHYGYLQTIRAFDDIGKHRDDMQRHLEMLQGDGSWVGGPFQARTETAINAVKNEMAKIQSQQFAFQAQLLDPGLVCPSIAFMNFVSTWLIRQVDPAKKHPQPIVSLPLPNEVPMAFRVLPEYILEDIVDYLLFVVRFSAENFELSGKNELVIFALTFLTSTWYIKNPFLKAKIIEVLFIGVVPFGRDRNGILGDVLNSHPLALKHLMSALMHFYIEVEQTGSHSQFYDKFNARRNIAYILKVVWNNPTHREALNIEARNVDRFVRFINLMINDVTFLLDESLSELTRIHDIQKEMENQSVWAAKPVQHRREREQTLRQLERHASGYITLGKSTVELLKSFTAETKPPFLMPEIIDRLAAMLDYNLEALVGPKCQNLKVKDPEKYKFDPKRLLSDILQVFLNLSDEGDFVRAVANDGRSYKKELFERAAEIARRRVLKTEAEIQQLLLFVTKVEDTKTTLEAEDDLGEIPDEFLDPLMCTVMRDPVVLPSSRIVINRSTIKAHLLSDATDPFNRVPLTIEEVVPDLELKARIESFLTERRMVVDKPDGDVDNMNVD